MNSKIISSSSKFISSILIVYSLFILLKGHNQPGGGFIGGLILALSFVYSNLGSKESLYFPISLTSIIGLGLTLCFGSGLLSIILGNEFFSHSWWFSIPLPLVGEYKIGSVVFFDIGVYLTVFASILMIIINLSDTEYA